MRICYALANQHLKDTAQVKIMDSLIKYAEKKHSVFYIPEKLGLFKTIDYCVFMKPDIIHSNGYKMSIYMWVVNLVVGARFFVLLSETIEAVDNWVLKRLSLFCLKKARVFVTSYFIHNQLKRLGVKSEVVRIG